VAVPDATAVTSPEAETAATEVLEDVQVAAVVTVDVEPSL
jgi:hypothetical protein